MRLFLVALAIVVTVRVTTRWWAEICMNDDQVDEGWETSVELQP